MQQNHDSRQTTTVEQQDVTSECIMTNKHVIGMYNVNCAWILL